jgi:integrase
LFDPEDIKVEIASRDITEGTKEKYVQVYDRFLRQHEIQWTKPRYKRRSKIPYVPRETDIDQLIGALSKRMGTFTQLLKETGARPGEAWSLQWTDIRKNLIVISEPEKGSNARQIKVSSRLIQMLNCLPRYSDYIFRRKNDSSFKSFQRCWYKNRKHIAGRLQNPLLLKVNMKALRHWKATMEYHRTKDILYVKQLLGHKRIENTLIYTHLVDFEEDDQYIVKVASTLDEFTNLLENGFEYISDYQDKKILRKRK